MGKEILLEESTRKYPNVMWFPRSKTDLREFREVLKIASLVQEENVPPFFNDKLLGKKMAEIGLINRVGMLPKEYIESYKKKSTGDVSYITNARMLMRLFRFFGWVRKVDKSKYILTDRGIAHSLFDGDYPDTKSGFNEEESILDSLKDFTFYSPNDTIENRDKKFKIRPFIWLLYNLNLEPQCIYQLIVTCFASRSESKDETKRIKDLLLRLNNGKTNLKKEFQNLGLDADDYSCVHNFYDSVKILVYVGVKLGFIEKTNNPQYGKKISGNAQNLKQASIFYKLTDRGKEYMQSNIDRKLVFFDDLGAKIKGEEGLLSALLLSILNFEIENKHILTISKSYLDTLFEMDITSLINKLNEVSSINIYISKGSVYLNNSISFNYWQSVPYEVITPKISGMMHKFYEDFKNNSTDLKIDVDGIKINEKNDLVDKFILSKDKFYPIPKFKTSQEAVAFVSYNDKNNTYGGQDRFSTRVSPTNSLIIVDGVIKTDSKDALDMVALLRQPSKDLKKFIDENIKELIEAFIDKSSLWYKDQHYVWVRNCFRLFGCEAIYSGSSGMLMRADISVTSPFMGGIEAKSPTENRGSVTSKAIRQANHAELQLKSLHKDVKSLSIAIALGRRVTPQAIKEERDVFRPNNQPVLIISDRTLYYLTLRLPFFKGISKDDVVLLFTKNYGHLNSDSLLSFFENMMSKKHITLEEFNLLKSEFTRLKLDSD